MSISKRVFWLLVALALSVSAQETRGKVQGDVRDPSGAVVGGATVTLSNDLSGVRAVRNSNETGHYLFDFVIPGQYSVTVEAKGFRVFVQKNILMESSGDVTVNVNLVVGNAKETVTVEAAPVSVEFNTATMSNTVDTQLANTLPIISRNPYLLASLNPAIVMRSTTQQEPFHFWAANQMDIGGPSYNQNDIVLDGSPQMTSQKSSYTPPVDAVQEVSVQQSGVDAEFGHSAGGVIVMSEKSGTNQFHGTAYFLHRNPALNALADRITQTKNMTRQTSWGGTIGNPIKKNKLFNFFAYEGMRIGDPLTSLVQTVPSAAERNGDFSQQKNSQGALDVIYDPWTTQTSGNTATRTPFPNNVIPTARFDSTASKIMGMIWQPNAAGDPTTGANNFKATVGEKYPYWNFMDRVDYNISDKLKFFARYNQLHTTQTTTDPTGGSAARYGQGSLRNAQSGAGDLVWMINPSTVFDVHGSYNGLNDSFYDGDILYGESGLANLWGGNSWYKAYSSTLPQVYFPYINVTQGSGLTTSNQYYWLQTPQTYNMAAKLSKEIGSHYLKFGAEYRREMVDAATIYFMQFAFDPSTTANTYLSPNTALSGNGWATFLLGALDSSSSIVNQVQTIPMQHPRVNFLGFYVQDDYKITKRLTLQLGLRDEYSGAMTDPTNRLSRYLDLNQAIPEFSGSKAPTLPASVTAMRTGAPTYNGAWIFTDSSNRNSWNPPSVLLEPRVGLALRLNDKTALRTGWARYTVPTTLNSSFSILGSVSYPGYDATSTAVAALQGVPQETLSNPFPGGLVQSVGKSLGTYTNLGTTGTWYNQNIKYAGEDRINVSLQRQLPMRLIADATFYLALSHNLPYTYNMNMADPNIAYTYKNASTTTVANPFYGLLPATQMPGQLRTQATVSSSVLLTPYPQYSTLNQLLMSGEGDRYKSMQLSLKRPYTNGMTLTLGYNYNREQTQGFYNDIATYAHQFTWIPAATSRHRLTGAAVYELPFGKGRKLMANANRVVDGMLGGWALSGIFTYNSGKPIRLGAAVVNGDPALSSPTRNLWFDTSKISVLPSYTVRTNPIQYDDLLGPRYVNLDMSLAKRFQITERAHFELRVEGYNMDNHLTLAAPVTTIGNTNYGKCIAESSGVYGRQVQFSGRVIF